MNTILVIENENLFGGNASGELRAEGVRVLHASSLDRALNKMVEYMDAVVVDCGTSGTCVRNAVTALKDRCPSIPVLVVGRSDNAVRFRSLCSSADIRYVDLDSGALMSTLQAALAATGRKMARAA